MNERLLNYLRSIGLAQDAGDDAAWDFFNNLRGLEANIAGALNYNDEDDVARANCDLMIRSLGYDPAEPTKKAKVEPAAGEPNAPPAAPAARTVAAPGASTDGASTDGSIERAAAEAAVTAERQRATRIRELGELASVPADVVRQAVDEGHTLERAQADFVSYVREHGRADVPADVPGAPAGHSRSSRSNYSRDSLLAAMLIREGVNDPTQAWPTMNPELGAIRRSVREDAQINEACERGYAMSGLAIRDLVIRCLEADGIRCEPTPAAIGRAIQQRGAAAMSGSTLTGVFTTSYAALMLAGYEDAPDTTGGWTVERDVPDFKLNERTRMGKMGPLSKRAKGQQADHMSTESGQETYKVHEYAGMFTIDWQDLVNDTFGALNDYTPSEMGEAARQLRPDLVYAVLLANANMRDGTALFHANHGNLKTSAALAVATLEAARSAMKIQQENSRNLNLMGEYLIVPATLEPTAETLVTSNLVVTGSDVVRGERNSNASAGLRVVSDARLDNGVIDPNTGTSYSGSTTTWFLAARGSRHTIEVGYLRGYNRAPQVRTKVLDHGEFGIGFDVQHVVGAKSLDWRGLVKNTA